MADADTRTQTRTHDRIGAAQARILECLAGPGGTHPRALTVTELRDAGAAPESVAADRGVDGLGKACERLYWRDMVDRDAEPIDGDGGVGPGGGKPRDRDRYRYRYSITPWGQAALRRWRGRGLPASST